MTSAERGTSDSPSPEPSVTPGLEPGGGVQPGDTPPAADSMSGSSSSSGTSSNTGPVSGNRTPMIITLVVLGLFVLLVLGYGVAQIAAYLSQQPGDEQSSLGRPVAAELLRQPPAR